VNKSQVLTVSDTGLTAELEVGFASIRERYVSHVTLESPNLIVAVAEDASLFRELVYHWRFTPGR
jgi:ribosome-associated toxin RatA of RatAB toxin-antitoxin module